MVPQRRRWLRPSKTFNEALPCPASSFLALPALTTPPPLTCGGGRHCRAAVERRLYARCPHGGAADRRGSIVSAADWGCFHGERHARRVAQAGRGRLERLAATTSSTEGNTVGEVPVSDGWHYAESGETAGPLDLKEMQMVLSKVSDPRNLLVWKVGFNDWKRAEDVQELAALISKPPPVPKLTAARSMPEGAWRSAAAIGVSVVTALAAGGIFATLAALPLVVALDWATRRRRSFFRSSSRGH
jgi:GYF domain 2